MSNFDTILAVTSLTPVTFYLIWFLLRAIKEEAPKAAILLNAILVPGYIGSLILISVTSWESETRAHIGVNQYPPIGESMLSIAFLALLVRCIQKVAFREAQHTATKLFLTYLLMLLAVWSYIYGSANKRLAYGFPAPSSALVVGETYHLASDEVLIPDKNSYRMRLTTSENIAREFILPERLLPGTYMAMTEAVEGGARLIKVDTNWPPESYYKNKSQYKNK